ncbi:hypothetical protein DSO57_1015055 [Entomophthora muscae]|uniref:Uncharacterized protein n=1 Tax=Entomophthora muscae TaxID=34485 RepID=A0ACC2TTU9_9FUNG|nr:hypothetical protein DSO57_1015055 [Entomophthora muscae]
MLQQTQVETVKGYFERWMAKFPTVKDLAQADIEEVNKTWAGLGYYQRARRLSECAKIIVSDHKSQIPSELEELLKLPGIGPYTAGAIGSIAFNRPYELVDGNVTRVLSRILAISGDVRSPNTVKKLWGAAKELLAKERAGDFNQAYMDLGSMICTPNSPKCTSCPFGGESHEPICKAYLESKVTLEAIDIENISSLFIKKEESEECNICTSKEFEVSSSCTFLVTRYPYKSPAKAPRVQESVVLVIKTKLPGSDIFSYLLLQRPKQGLLAGLWMFPTHDFPEQIVPKGKDKSKPSQASENEPKDHPKGIQHIFESLAALSFSLDSKLLDQVKSCGSVLHIFSHIRQTYHVYTLTLPSISSYALDDGILRWCSDLSSQPIPTAYQKVFKVATSKK